MRWLRLKKRSNASAPKKYEQPRWLLGWKPPSSSPVSLDVGSDQSRSLVRAPENAGLGRLAQPVDFVEVGERFELGRDSAVDGEELSVKHGGEREALEQLDEQIVDVLVVLVQTLVAEVEVGGHLATLVVAAQQVHGFGEVELQRQHQDHDLDRKRAAVDEVAEEEELGFLWSAGQRQQLQQVVELAVNVADDGDGVLEVKQVRLLAEQLSGQREQLDQVGLVHRTFVAQQLAQVFPVGQIWSAHSRRWWSPKRRRSLAACGPEI